MHDIASLPWDKSPVLKSESENDVLDYLTSGDNKKKDTRSKSIPSDLKEDTATDKSKKSTKKVTIAPTPESNLEIDNQDVRASPKLRSNQDSPNKRGKTPPQVPPRHSPDKKASDSKTDSLMNKESEQKVGSVKDEKKSRRDAADRDESPDENFGKESSGSSPSLSSKKKGRKPDVPPRTQTPKSKRENDDGIGSRKSSDTGSKRNSSIDIGKRKSSDTGSKRNSSIDTGIDHRKSSDSSSKRNASISSHQGIL